jgi:hypothetical protein
VVVTWLAKFVVEKKVLLDWQYCRSSTLPQYIYPFGQ